MPSHLDHTGIVNLLFVVGIIRIVTEYQMTEIVHIVRKAQCHRIGNYSLGGLPNLCCSRILMFVLRIIRILFRCEYNQHKRGMIIPKKKEVACAELARSLNGRQFRGLCASIDASTEGASLSHA